MNAVTEPSRFSTAPQSRWLDPHPALGISLMDHLFNRLDGAYPNRWRAAFATDQAIANWRESWAESFEAVRLTPDEVKAGLNRCRAKLDWPPSIAEFIKACRPPVNYDAALYEACQQLRLRSEGKDEWTNPAFFWAAVKVGEYDMLNVSHGQLIKRFAAALDEVLESDVQPVPARAIALPAPGHTRAAPERVKAEVEKVRALQKGVGNKDWAHRVLERAKGKDKPSITVVDMAKRALGLPTGVTA